MLMRPIGACSCGTSRDPFTFTDILRYGAMVGGGARSDEGNIDALIARLRPRCRSTRQKSCEDDPVHERWFWIEHGRSRKSSNYSRMPLRRASRAASVRVPNSPNSGSRLDQQQDQEKTGAYSHIVALQILLSQGKTSRLADRRPILMALPGVTSAGAGARRRSHPPLIRNTSVHDGSI